MKLLIVESPGKLKTLKKILGDDWECHASFGHIRDLPKDEMGVEPPTFSPKYVFNDKGKGVVAKLKSLAERADEVYLASDPDREGEAISWHLKEVLKVKSYKRVTFNEITKSAVLSAISNPRQIDINLVAAQEARRVLDRLVGYTVSPALSNQLNRTGLSAGRVQSPATRLVVDREREIASFVPTNHFGVKLTFEGNWFGEWFFKKMLPEGAEYWTDQVFAEKVSKIRKVSVFAYKEGESSRPPPPPFTTSTLQQAASVALKFNPKTTMSLAQKLYEGAHITYMRTDNPNLSDDAYKAISEYAREKGLPLNPTHRKWKAKDGAQEAHEAVRPTHFEVEVAGDTPEEQKLYTLIRNRAIASQLADATYATRRAILKADDQVDGKDIYFEAKGKTLLTPGWLSLTQSDQTEDAADKEAEPDNPIPALVEGDRLEAIKGELQNKVTKPPVRYSEASLIKELESRGIGRPATFASIISNIVDKSYVRVEKGKLHATDIGFAIIDALVGNFSFLNYDFTKDLESYLDDVAAGKLKYVKILTDAHNVLISELDKLKLVTSSFAGATHSCPKSGHPLRRIKGKSGFFWGCSGYPTCSATYPDEKGSPQFEVAESAHKCPSCGKGLTKKKGSSGAFWGCSGYPDCKTTFPDLKGKPDFNKTSGGSSSGAKPPAIKSEHKCKVCGSALIHRVKEGAYNFWGCSGFPKCKQSYKDKNGSPDFG